MTNFIIPIIGIILILIYFIILYNNNLKIKTYKNNYLESRIPVIIETYIRNNSVSTKLYIRNVSDKKIKGIQLSFWYKDSFNKITECHTKIIDHLLENDYRKHSIDIEEYIGKSNKVLIEKVIFTNNTVWKNDLLIEWEEQFQCSSFEELIRHTESIEMQLKMDLKRLQVLQTNKK